MVGNYPPPEVLMCPTLTGLLGVATTALVVLSALLTVADATYRVLMALG
jgi:hypothetical protein